ncbi:ArsR/SmtB family transcription factor [Paenibacillus harenae]|uniref:ArsR family transcriptional regulator n=1 Tax=Paenibacillus harenae TaxID=306543 RepID=A0ABT9U9B3_PAEHA|nr:metalloregulator ArsR/SmtB family transcription factor [Paenibacillus harenae]MDQ0116235.1 ArsR family transcriptional regulator [Paenibacillus harenae]
METALYDVKAKFMRGFSDKSRLQILASIKDGEKTVSQIVDDMQGSQSNISQHLSCLKDCGIIVSRQEGKFVYYSLRNVQIASFIDAMDVVFNQVENEVAACEQIDKMNCCSKH